MNNGGWIKSFRKLLDWGWFTVPNTAHLFHYCLLKANTTDKMWHGQLVARGSFITSRNSLSVGTGLTEQEVRTALDHLTQTGEIQCTSTNLYTLITICNYAIYQGAEDNDQPTEQPANQPPIQPTEQPANQPQHKNIRSKKKECINTPTNVGVSGCDPDDATEKGESIDYGKLITYWNETTKGVYGILRTIDNNRRKMVLARVRQHSKQALVEAIDKAANSDYLKSVKWFSFDWMIHPNNFDKVISGNYDDRATAAQPAANLTYTTKDTGGNLVLCYNDRNGQPVVIPFDAPQRPNANCDYDPINNQWINRQ